MTQRAPSSRFQCSDIYQQEISHCDEDIVTLEDTLGKEYDPDE